MYTAVTGDYSLIDSLQKCTEQTDDLMCLNFFQLNTDETEMIVSDTI